MPKGDFTVEFWARTQPKMSDKVNETPQDLTEFFSYATMSDGIDEDLIYG